MPAKVIVRDLQKRYGNVEAARGVSFEIPEAEIFGLIGPNGAGKTTTVECIIGLREPDAGTIEVCGIDARRHPREVKRRIGAALQTTALQDKITPREAVSLFGALYGLRREAEPLLDRFGLADKADTSFDTLSGGQRQRLALALAFVNEPDVVILDEPTSGLDAHSRRDLHGEILKMRADGHTVLLTTHYMEEAEALCDRIAVIDRGRIIASGGTRELMARSAAPPSIFVAAAGPLDCAALSAIPGIADLACEGTTARFTAADVNAAVGSLLALLQSRGLDIVELHVRKASLEDVFLELTRETAAG